MEPNTGQTASTNRTGESTRIFISHVKQYFNSLPLFSLSVIAITWLIGLADVLGRVSPSQTNLVSQWLYLSANKVLYGLQGHRILLYPLASPGISLLLTNTLLALPYMAAMERKQGTVRLAWLLISLYTCAIGLAYVILISLFSSIARYHSCAGLSAWTVALAVWSAMEEEAEGQSNDRMLFGVIHLPGKAMPFLIIAFYFFLVPDTSLVLHVLAAGTAYCYFKKRIPARLLPSEDTYRHYQSRPWLEHVTGNPRFISMDAASSGYLPIHNNSANVASAHSPSGGFPGQGRRLGDE
ncbi:hypothetical protein BJV82DRAFT_600194 [Fennellomyces sp. T-0311]|nr:hypothetical protein BJV82DRAFT_600194 [Fennellomyces sp. T-0311]